MSEQIHSSVNTPPAILLARRLFADMSAEEFDGFGARLSHVLDRLRTLLSQPAHDGS